MSPHLPHIAEPAAGGAERHRHPRHLRPGGVRRGDRHPVDPPDGQSFAYLRPLGRAEALLESASFDTVARKTGETPLLRVSSSAASGDPVYRGPHGEWLHTARVLALRDYRTPAHPPGHEARPRQAQRRLRHSPHSRGERASGRPLARKSASAANLASQPAVAAARQRVSTAGRPGSTSAAGVAAPCHARRSSRRGDLGFIDEELPPRQLAAVFRSALPVVLRKKIVASGVG